MANFGGNFAAAAEGLTRSVDNVRHLIDSRAINENIIKPDYVSKHIIDIDFTKSVSTPANDQPTSIIGRLKRGVSNFVDSVRPYRVPEKITPTSISFERDNFVKITTTLGTDTQERPNGPFSEVQPAEREREVWVKLGKASYRHLLDMAIHHPIMQQHMLETGLDKLHVAKSAPKTLPERFNLAAQGTIENMISYIKRAKPKGKSWDMNKTAAEIVAEGPQVTTDDLNKALQSIAGQITITPHNPGGYVTPRDGTNRVFADGEFIAATAEFTGFGKGEFSPKGAETIQEKFGLREEGLSPKTLKLARAGLNRDIREVIMPASVPVPTLDMR